MAEGIEIQPHDHRLRVIGDLTMKSVLKIKVLGLQAIQQFEAFITVDLKDLTHTDSAGLVLLLGWLRAAQQDHKKLVFTHVPQQLQALASVSGVEHFFRLNSNG